MYYEVSIPLVLGITDSWSWTPRLKGVLPGVRDYSLLNELSGQRMYPPQPKNGCVLYGDECCCCAWSCMFYSDHCEAIIVVCHRQHTAFYWWYCKGGAVEPHCSFHYLLQRQNYCSFLTMSGKSILATSFAHLHWTYPPFPAVWLVLVPTGQALCLVWMVQCLG